jgi:hypothetical protein
MIQKSPHAPQTGYNARRGAKMIRETEAFLNRQPITTPMGGHRAKHARQSHGDPRRPAHLSATRVVPTGRQRTVLLNTLVRVPTDEHGELNELLLDQWGIRLSRLIDMPFRGNVLLDLNDVVSVPARFVSVYEWFRRHLSNQGRSVFLQIRGRCLENTRPDELTEFMTVKSSRA